MKTKFALLIASELPYLIMISWVLLHSYGLFIRTQVLLMQIYAFVFLYVLILGPRSEISEAEGCFSSGLPFDYSVKNRQGAKRNESISEC